MTGEDAYLPKKVAQDCILLAPVLPQGKAASPPRQMIPVGTRCAASGNQSAALEFFSPSGTKNKEPRTKNDIEKKARPRLFHQPVARRSQQIKRSKTGKLSLPKEAKR
jgi:hypothetical protein